MTGKPLLKGELIKNASLAQYTSWRVGGLAKQLYKPAGLNDLSEFLKTLPDDEPLLWLGLGSNTLVRDNGFDGTIISTLSGLNAISQLDDMS